MELNAEAIVKEALDKAVEVIAEKPLYAEMILSQLLRAIPDHSKATHLLGLAKQRVGKHEEAVVLISRAMEMEPDNLDNYNNLALSYAHLDDYDKAIEYLEEAVARNPQHHIYLNNLALQYRQKKDFMRAKDIFIRALAVKSTPEIWCNLGGLYHEMKDIDQAIHCFETAVVLDPACSAAHVDLAFSLCSKGEWEKGFTEYEWRFRHFHQLHEYLKAYESIPPWKGEDLTGEHIIIYGEQGNGDVIQFSRYIRNLKKMGAFVTVHCPIPLQSLLLSVDGIDRTMAPDDWVSFAGWLADESRSHNHYGDYNYHCSLMSLPDLLKDYTITGEPYIKIDERMNLRASKDYSQTYNIGIVWAGSPAHPNDEIRSMFLRDFIPLSQLPGVKLFSLQVGGCKRAYTNGKRIVDYAQGAEEMSLVDMTPEIQNYSDAAKIIAGMDLIVSVDTSIVHLAGAMGVKCYMLTPYNPDWRWGMEGVITPWYDSLKLYRQDRPNDWSHVMERIVEDVRRESEVLLQNIRQELPQGEAAGSRQVSLPGQLPPGDRL